MNAQLSRCARHTVMLLLAAGVLASTYAIAQTAKDSPGRITKSTATSRCIDEPSTPVCATETLLACQLRAEAALCRSVGAAIPASPADGAAQIEYVIERVGVIRPEDISEDLKDLDWYKPGYTLVELLRRTCPASQLDCRDESWEGVQVYLRSRGAGWDIVHWRSDAEQDTPPEEPDNFQRPNAPAQ